MKKYKQRKKRQNEINSKSSKFVLIIFAICIPIVLCIAQAFFNYWNINRVLNIFNNGEAIIYKAVSETMQLDIVNTGMSVIAIAVSIWIGLNIYNNCKESELEKKIERLEMENSKLTRERIKSLFLIELRKTEESYEISAYFSKKFNEEKEISERVLENMILVEKDFCVCCKAYENRKMDSCCEYAKRVLDGLNEIEIEANSTDLIKLYKEIRESDAYFYKNMSSREMNYEELIKSIKLYQKVINYFERKEKDNTNLLRGYLENTVGYTYLVLYREFPKLEEREKKKGVEKKEERKIEERKIEERNILLKKALCELDKAVHHNPKGRYFQNLGAYYEVSASINGINEYYNAIKQYKKALNSENCDKKVYNLLGSALLKLIEKKLEIDVRFDHKKLLKDFSLKDLGEKEREEIEHKIIEAYTWLSHAVTATPYLIDAYYNFGKANFYFWKFIDNDIEKKKNAERYISYAYLMGGKTQGVIFTYRNYYEIIGNISKAREYNHMLGEKGDANKAEELYKLYVYDK